MKVVVIGKRKIVVAFIYIIMKIGIKQDCPPIARFIDYFLYFLTRLVRKFWQNIYRLERAGF
jgi:hypothetical protein